MVETSNKFAKDSTIVFSKNNDLKIDSLMKIDFISYPYKHLDENLKIRISDSLFQETVLKYKFFPKRIKRYRDSLGVVLMAEFGDWQKENAGKLAILFTWERLGLYLDSNKEHLLQLSNDLKLKHPYQIYLFFRQENDKMIDNPIKLKELEQLRNRMSQQTGVELLKIKKFSNEDLLRFAFKNNPKIIKLRNDFEKNHKNHSTLEIN